MCHHPAPGWAHRFARPLGPRYGTSWEPLLRNCLIGRREIGWDTASVEAHFREQFEQIGLGPRFDSVLEQTAREASSPLSFFDGSSV